MSLRCFSSGSSACSPSFASPTTGTSVAILPPARAGSASICATRTLPGAGRCLVYGKFVPTRNRVSISSISSSDGRVPSSPIPPVVYGESSGTQAFPDSVLTIGCPELLGHGQQFLPGMPGTRAGQDRDLLTAAEQVRDLLQVLVPGAARCLEHDRRGVRRPGRGHVLPRVRVGVRHLDVVGHRDVRDTAPGVGRPDRVVHHGRQLRRVVDHLVVLGDVGVELVQVDLLLVPGAQHRGLLHAGDGEHRHVVELGVVEAVQQVDTARPGRRQAHADLAGRLGVRGRHERRRFLVVHQHEPDPVLVPAQALHEPVDAISRQAEHGVHAPVRQALDECLRCDLTHDGPPVSVASRLCMPYGTSHSHCP